MRKFTENRKIKFWIAVGRKKGSKLLWNEIFSTKKSALSFKKAFGWKIVKVEINKI